MVKTNGPVTDVNEADPSPRLLVVSSEDQGGITRQASVFEMYFKQLSLGEDEPEYLYYLARQLALSRSPRIWKSYVIAGSVESLKDFGKSLSKPQEARKTTGIAYVFTGQGAQYSRMGIALYRYPVFQSSIRRCEQILTEFGCQWNVSGK